MFKKYMPISYSDEQDPKERVPSVETRFESTERPKSQLTQKAFENSDTNTAIIGGSLVIRYVKYA